MKKRASDAGTSNRGWESPGLGSKTTSLGSLGGGVPLARSPLALTPPSQQLGFSRWSTSRLNSAQVKLKLLHFILFYYFQCLIFILIFFRHLRALQPEAVLEVEPYHRLHLRLDHLVHLVQLELHIWAGEVKKDFLHLELHMKGIFVIMLPLFLFKSMHSIIFNLYNLSYSYRLAVSLLPNSPPVPANVSDEIQSSIKEVTSAIVHYVSGLEPNQDRLNVESDRSNSPRGSPRLCWLESSFVGELFCCFTFICCIFCRRIYIVCIIFLIIQVRNL